jgi:ABC-2 type transport system ATP-binding protein
VDGRRYADHPAPLRAVGALLEARAFDRGRSARNHLLALARTHGIGPARVDAVLERAGLADAARRRAGGFSLGMGQRLGIAAALLGDPGTLILDEPVNGLDPDGVLWIRTLLRELAAEGRTVLVSSHLMSEMAVTADHLVIIGRGRLLADTTVADLIDAAGIGRVLVRSPRAADLRLPLLRSGAAVTGGGPGELVVQGLEAARIGEVALAAGVPLHELAPQRASLEQAYMDLTRESVEYAGTADGQRGREVAA